MTVLPWIRRRANLVVSPHVFQGRGTGGAAAGRALRARGPRRRDAPRLHAVSGEQRGAGRGRSGSRGPRGSCAATSARCSPAASNWRAASSGWACASFPAAPIFCWSILARAAAELVRRLARRGILLRDRAGEFGRDGFVRITAGTLRADAAAVARDRGGTVKFSPKLVIFDVDGVLVDVHGSFHRSIIDTVHHFTKHRPTYAEIQKWKRQTGYNDDWRLSTDWVESLGTKVEYAKVKRQFQKFYWGVNGKRGNVLRERWLVPRRRLERWAKRAELALFTGRTRQELKFTLDHFGVADLFRRVVAMDDVERLKPDPEGMHFLLDGKPPSRRSISATFWTTRWPREAPACRFWACCRAAATRVACAAGSCAARGAGSSRQRQRTGEVLEMRRAAIHRTTTKPTFACASIWTARPRAGLDRHSLPRPHARTGGAARRDGSGDSWPRAIWTWTSTTPSRIWASRWARRCAGAGLEEAASCAPDIS